MTATASAGPSGHSILSVTPPTAPRVATVCGYTFAEAGTSWRSHVWEAADCSNGLPAAGWVGVGQGENGSGTSGQVWCTPAGGNHYDHPTHAGATSARVSCFYAPPAAVPPVPAVTTCTYTFSEVTTGWRTRPWAAGDCSQGLPPAGARAVGQGSNGGGTGGMVSCSATSGSHYNHPTHDGATIGVVTCTYVDPAPQADPELTLCAASFPEVGSGWRSRPWVAADCTHGLPRAGAWGLGSGTNGAGTPQQVACSPTTGGHYNGAVTSGAVQCLFQNPPVPPESGGGNDALWANGAADINVTGHFWTARGKTNASPEWTPETASRNRVDWDGVFQPRDISVKGPAATMDGVKVSGGQQ